jgi:DNA helicase II / ATP-dependent DNA helicase PcrA
VVTIFQSHDDVLEQYQRWFRYILVDEYQDTNVAQYLWLRLLAGRGTSQHLLRGRRRPVDLWLARRRSGQHPAVRKGFSGRQVVRLEQNYRSTPHILAAASGVIAGQQGAAGQGALDRRAGGEKVRLIGHWDGEEEARWIGEEIEAMQSRHPRHGPMDPTRWRSSCAPPTRCARSRTGS